MMNAQIKDLYLHEELRTSQQLIVAGLGELQEINMGEDFYHLPHLLLASGLERYMKCYICLVYETRTGNYPDFQMLKNLGHDLIKLKDEIITNYFGGTERPAIDDDLSFIRDSDQLKTILKILSEFGKFARYYNLDVVTGRASPSSFDSRKEWENLEKSIEDPIPYLASGNQDALHNDYYPKVNSHIIAIIERFVRAITRQFTLGGHDKKLCQFYMAFSDFLSMNDDALGTVDYRQSVRVLQAKKENWVKRTLDEIRGSPWPKKELNKSQYTEREWPFRTDKVIIEARDRIFYIINIEGYDFALNGSAKSKYKLPTPHDAGLAIIGKSVGPFINIASKLADETKGGNS